MLILKKRIIPVFIAALMFFTLVNFTASAEEISTDYKYEIENGTARIVKYTGNSAEVIIPNTLGGYPVTSIGQYRSEERRVGKECRSRWSPYH